MEARLMYVATDNLVEVRNEINDMPKDSEGDKLLMEGAC